MGDWIPGESGEFFYYDWVTTWSFGAEQNGYWRDVKIEGSTVTFKLCKNCEVSAAMGIGISSINPTEGQLTTGMSKINAVKIDSIAPYVTDIKFPEGATRDTHSTAIQFTIKDDGSGLSDGYWTNTSSTEITVGKLTPKCKYDAYIEQQGIDDLAPVDSQKFTLTDGTKENTIVLSWNNIYLLTEAKLRVEITLTDLTGNRSTTTVYTEPTLAPSSDRPYIYNTANEYVR